MIDGFDGFDHPIVSEEGERRNENRYRLDSSDVMIVRNRNTKMSVRYSATERRSLLPLCRMKLEERNKMMNPVCQTADHIGSPVFASIV